MIVATLDISSQRTDFDRSVNLIAQIKAPFALSLQMSRELMVIADEFCQAQERYQTLLINARLSIEKLADIDPLDLVLHMGSDTYAELYRSRDITQSTIDDCIEFSAQMTRLNKGFPGIVHRLVRYVPLRKMIRSNKQTMDLARKVLSLQDKSFEDMDRAVAVQPLKAGFQNISAAQLWEDRCKAQEYLV